MQSYFEKRGPRLDTTLPSVRHLQELIRTATVVTVRMRGGVVLEGTLKWQDSEFLALSQDPNASLVLLNRDAVVLLRGLG